MSNYVNCDILLYSGYMFSEYATLGQLSTKVDVYSFGILLLEIISGRKAILQNATNNMYLVEWVRTFDYLVFNPFIYIYIYIFFIFYLF